jgi:hypothetical protein
VNVTRSIPVTVSLESATAKRSETTGRFGSGSACAGAHEGAPGADDDGDAVGETVAGTEGDGDRDVPADGETVVVMTDGDGAASREPSVHAGSTNAAATSRRAARATGREERLMGSR